MYFGHGLGGFDSRSSVYVLQRHHVATRPPPRRGEGGQVWELAAGGQALGGWLLVLTHIGRRGCGGGFNP